MGKNTKEILTDCTLCYHSCGCVVTIEDGKAVNVKGLESHPLNKGKLCPKGEVALENIYHPDRIKYPMKRINGSFERVSWDQALAEIAEKLLTLKAEFGPSVLGVFSGAARVQFGGENGVVLEVRAGDVVVIPAGVSHKNLGASRDFGVVGAYPKGQRWDMQYGKPGERPAADARIARVDMPAADPVLGETGPLVSLWRKK